MVLTMQRGECVDCMVGRDVTVGWERRRQRRTSFSPLECKIQIVFRVLGAGRDGKAEDDWRISSSGWCWVPTGTKALWWEGVALDVLRDLSS